MTFSESHARIRTHIFVDGPGSGAQALTHRRWFLVYATIQGSQCTVFKVIIASDEQAVKHMVNNKHMFG